MRYSIYFLFVFLFISCVSENTEKAPVFPRSALDTAKLFIASGDYKDIKVGVRGNRLTAIYKQDELACYFFLEGNIGNQNPIKLNAFQLNEPSNNTTAFIKSFDDALLVKLDEMKFQNCSKELISNAGSAAILQKAYNWSEIRIVKHQCELYEDYGGGLTTGIEILEGVPVAISRRVEGWVYVVNLDDMNYEGWIKEYFLYPLKK